MTESARSAELTEDVVAVLADPSTERIERFLQVHHDHWQRMARSLVTRHKIEDFSYLDEAYQCVVEEAWSLLVHPPEDLVVASFGRLVLFRANSRFIKVMRKIPLLSGVSDLMARRAAFDRTRRAMLFELGYEPDQADVIERHNIEARKKVTEEDLTAIGEVVWVDGVAASRDQTGTDVIDTLCAVRPADTDMIDLGDVLAQTIIECDDADREIIEAHIAYSLDNGIPATRTAIARQCGVSPVRVSSALARFHDDLVASLDAAR